MNNQPNEKQMELAYHILALDGDWGSVRNQMGDPKFEKFTEKEALRIARTLPSSIVNSQENYGIRKKEMSDCFLNYQSQSYTGLEKILAGLNNSDVPHKILRGLNSSEILALYCGVGHLKTHGYLNLQNKEVDFKGFMEMDFSEQISLLVKYGYNYNSIRQMKNHVFIEHPTKPGELKKRMSGIHPEIQNQFIESLKKSPRKSERYDKINGYYDPNKEDKRDKTARKFYIDAIFKILSNIYNKNIQYK